MVNGPAASPDERPRVLVAEDDFLIAMDLESLLAEEGWQVVGPVATVAAALRSIEEGPLDAALLDINLGGERVAPVAKGLRDRSVPFVLVSGYTQAQSLEEELAGAPRVNKPFEAREIVRAVRKMLS